eukprot:83118_1
MSTPNSYNSPEMRKLEDALNGGKPVNIAEYDALINRMKTMGFTIEQTLEAALIQQSKEEEVITQFLLSDDKNQKQLREERIFRIEAAVAKERDELLNKIEQMKEQIDKERELQRQLILEQESNKSQKEHVYTEFLRGLTADDQKIDPIEVNELEKMKSELGITQEQHAEALKKLGYTLKAFQERQVVDDSSSCDPRCYQCGVPGKDHVLLECGHLCLCEKCGKQMNDVVTKKVKGKKPKCPICRKKVKQVVKVFT